MSSVQCALISVSEKTGVVGFCKELATLNIKIISTGGTAKLLIENGISVTEVSEHTGFPEIMDGRVKTLHPLIHGGLLARRGQDDAIMQAYDIEAIDLLAVNLYPFEATVSRAECSLEEAIENIDIGGPSMLRAAAKNHAHVGVIVDVSDYSQVISELKQHNNQLSDATRFSLAQKVFAHTANYDAAVSNYLSAITADGDTLAYPQSYSMRIANRPLPVHRVCVC